jgi:PAS domain S-box-containing protein
MAAVKTTYDVLQWVQLVVFVVLGIAAAVQWLRRRSATTAWLAATFGLLAIVVVVTKLIPEDSDSSLVQWITKAELAVIALFPYFLYRFMGSLIGRPIRWIFWVANALTAAVIVYALLLPEFPKPGEPRSVAVEAFIILLIAQWTYLLSIVGARLWRGGRGQPTVTRRRMRTMSLGAIGLAVALILAGFAPADQRVNALQLAISLLGIAAGPLFLLGFATPSGVRAAWRKYEETKFREAELGLMEARRPVDVADALLPHVSDLLGGRGSVLLDKEGRALGVHGFDLSEIDAIAAHVKSTATPAEQAAAGGAILSVPMKSGWLAVQASPYAPFFGRDESEMMQALALLTDLALGRIELSEREAGLQEQLLEAQRIAHIGSWEWDLDSGELTWSDEMYRIYGVDPATFDPTHANPGDLTHADDRERVSQMTQIAREAGQPFEYEFRVQRPDGETVVVLARGKLVDGDPGDGHKMIGTVQDITQQKEQAALRDQFIANAAHELRTPMTTLLGLTNMLALNRDRLNERQVNEAYDVVVRAGDRLTALINNLLDLTKLQQGTIALSLQPVPIAEVSREIVEATPPPEGVSVEVEVPDDLVAVTDPQRFDQVVSNLLTNAYRYGGPEIVVAGESKNGSVFVSISDNGPGVDAKLVPRMFDPFERGQGSGEVGGSGLGLAIVKMLVEASNGEISYDPNGGGARFVIRLPSS